MPRKAEHLSFQGKKRFWKSELGLRSYFIFCAAIPILSTREISKKAKIDDANLLITPLFLNRFSKSFFSSESCHAKLPEETRIFEIDSETWELWLKNVCARTKSEYLHKKWNNSLTHAPIFKIFFPLRAEMFSFPRHVVFPLYLFQNPRYWLTKWCNRTYGTHCNTLI